MDILAPVWERAKSQETLQQNGYRLRLNSVLLMCLLDGF
ncbi:hypothetical protein SPBRAN_388 [uncultured Candidatus Thioglobus sp.]|nr:hypothetical protein SPBRAN_388 [uncultured Candidatus Thioglobus sp.]